ncbi:MAG: methylated-DNA--[protein]-cysteine S-methyltransferase [Gallionellaceae bacterium]|nr:methylated-DNA--[protein]-cysteine S-methyltransferase [Gallionellaceae bacterium]
MDYQAKLQTPFGILGIRCTAHALTHIEFLAPGTAPQPPDHALAQTICEQLKAYCADAEFHFDLPLQLNGTPHQTKVWQAMRALSAGQTCHYGDLAVQLNSSPRAVGQACGSNPIPIIIPCHRVTSKAGMGGFMHHSSGYALDIKRWLLAHEAITSSPLPLRAAQNMEKWSAAPL